MRVETVRGDKRIEQLQERRAVFLPEQLDVKAHTTSKVLYRSIYEVAVYTARANLGGSLPRARHGRRCKRRGQRALERCDFRARPHRLRRHARHLRRHGASEPHAGLAMLVVLSTLYGLLYLILKLEDYALLAGAMLGFAALTVVMFATLRVDWSGRRGAPRPGGVRPNPLSGFFAKLSSGKSHSTWSPLLAPELFLHLGGKLRQRERLGQEGVFLVVVQALLEGIVGIARDEDELERRIASCAAL